MRTFARILLWLVLAVAFAAVVVVPLVSVLAQERACFAADETRAREVLAQEFGESLVETLETSEGVLRLYRNDASGTWTALLWPNSGSGEVMCAAGSGDASDDPRSLANPARGA